VYPNGFEALRTVSMGVGEGEIVALIGRSGAGKSTLLRCLNGMQRPTSGQVMLDDVDVCRLYDGTHLELPGRPDWTWHVTCVRNSRSRPDLEALRRAATELDLDAAWPIDTIAYLELRGDRYEALATWQV